MSQLDTQPDLPAPEPRLSQADTLAALTPDDLDSSKTMEPALESRWVTRFLTEFPLPDGAPGSPVVDPPSLSSLTACSYRGAAAGPSPGFGTRTLDSSCEH